MQQKQWGCYEPVHQPWPYPRESPITTCPLTFFRDSGPEFEQRVMLYHLNWKQGHLPEPGGVLDQGAAYMEAMAAVEAGMRAAEEVKMEQARREQAKKQRHAAAKSGGGKAVRKVSQ